MNLRELSRIEGFDTALLTTYQFDPIFFERIVLRDLLASGARQIIVLADGTRASESVFTVRDQLADLGRRYRLFPVWSRGSFHPKLFVRFGGNGALVACGSTNITHPGWLGVRSTTVTNGNLEASGAWRVNPRTPDSADLRLALRSLASQLPASAGRAAIEETIASSWLGREDAHPGGRLLVSSGTRALGPQLAERWRGRRFHRMWMATGSTDSRGAMLEWAHDLFGVTEAIVHLDPSLSIFDATSLSRLPVKVRIRCCPPRPRPHQKVVVFEGDGGLAAVYGSANCSAAAWLLPPSEGGNVEAIVVQDRVTKEDVSDILDLSDTDAVDPAAVSFARAEHRRGETNSAQRLLHAALVQSTGQLTCVFQRSLPSGSEVTLEVEGSRARASEVTPDRWTARIEELDVRPRTRFVTARAGGAEAGVYSCWLEDSEMLAELNAAALDIGAIAALRPGGPGSDPADALRGLAKLSHWLLRDWGEEDDRLVSTPVSDSTADDGDAQSVSPAEIFRSLDDLDAVPNRLSSIMGVGALSLAGIMRLVFGATVAQRDQGATDAVGDELRSEGGPSDGSEAEGATSGEVPESPGVEVTDAQRSRLIRQVHRFVDSLVDPRFAARCTARQLQQAVAFPLACALLAVQGDWVRSETDRVGWTEIVRRVCELLLVSRASAGATPKGSILELAAARYAAAGRRNDFDAVIGDGTIWVLLLAVATHLAIGVDGLERDIILSDVLDCTVLRSQRTAFELADLCAVVQVEDRTREWVRSAREAAARIQLIRSLVVPLQPLLPQRPQGKPRAGDWLWNAPAGFARIKALNDDGLALVHIRRRAETRPNVRLDYYVNLRLAGILDSIHPR